MIVEVLDPSTCCSTGVCGPSVDPALPRFAADLDWLAEHGIEVARHNLGQHPGMGPALGWPTDGAGEMPAEPGRTPPLALTPGTC